MVTKKKLIADIKALSEETAILRTELKESKAFAEMLFNAIKALNGKLNKHLKDEEKQGNEESVKIAKWLNDPRIEDVQQFINKGDK